MTTQPLQTPSCSKAFERSMEWTKRVLFPFDFSRWITFAVSAWLMSFGQGGGTNFNFSGGGNSGGGGGNNLPGGHELQEAAQWFDNHFGTILLVGAAVVLLIIGISALLTWLTSRAEFMFLDGVVTGEPKIAESWSSTKELGNSLFQFRFCLFLANFFASLLAIAILAVPAFLVFKQPDLGTSLVFGAMFLGMTFWAGASFGDLLVLASPIITLILNAVDKPLLAWIYRGVPMGTDLANVTPTGYENYIWIGFIIFLGVFLTCFWRVRNMNVFVRLFLIICIVAVNFVAAEARPKLWNVLKPYQQKRLTSFVNPYSDPRGSG
ncbi:MAG TPA: hypothetical protein PK988_09045, partial [Candidatus Sumerlaeota bacterium]|nr:hypothetical protein [Candidatus Sumerlaeota bacterium]